MDRTRSRENTPRQPPLGPVRAGGPRGHNGAMSHGQDAVDTPLGAWARRHRHLVWSNIHAGVDRMRPGAPLGGGRGVSPWSVLGLVFVALGAVGAVLPLLPTTPFILLAAGCFARSSPRLHRWLLESELFGPTLRDWEQRRCMGRGVRRLALSMMALLGGTSVVFFVPPGWPQAAGVALIALGFYAVLAVRLCPGDDDAP